VITLRTVDGEVDPRAVDCAVVSAFQRYHRTLVPALVLRAQVADLDGGHLDEPDASLVTLVDVRRIAVELDEDGHLLTLLAPGHDVLHASRADAGADGVRAELCGQAGRAKHVAVQARGVALQQLAAADVGRLLDGAPGKPDRRCNSRIIIIIIISRR